jgi:dihydrolipoamide dehydrogenase
MAVRIAVLGAGPGGYVAAIRAAQLGAEVTVIEQDNVGGACLNWGCIPSKVMITVAEMLEKFHQAGEFGLRLEGKVIPDMQRLMARKEKVIRDQSQGILDLFQHNKIRYVRGKGVIESLGLAVVGLEDGKTLEVPWDRLIVATGTQPLNLPAFPFDGEQILSSNDALCLQEVPESILILGGGVIGCEFAFLLTALGSRVTLVEALDRVLPLPSVDEDCSKVILREMKKRKIKCMVKQTVERVERRGGKLRVSIGTPPSSPDPQGKSPISLEVDKVLVCIGRRPNTANIGLEKLGVNLDPNGWIVVDERMQTSLSGVYAIGDVLGPSKVMLAHVASSEGLAAAENAAGGDRGMDYSVVPGAIFTMPEVANVGLSEVQARAQGLPVRTESVLFRNIGKAQVIGEIAGEAKIVSNAETGRVLGVHIVGPHATELIAEGALAVKMGATVKDLAETIHAHPTLAEVMREASRKFLDQS